MTYNGATVTGRSRLSSLSTHLQSCFFKSSVNFSSAFDIFKKEALGSTHLDLWCEYENCFAATEIREAIESLDSKKDAGSMGISAEFIRANTEFCTPLFRHLFNYTMATGYIPKSWKMAFITQIPKKRPTERCTRTDVAY